MTFARTATGSYVPGLADGTATGYTMGGQLFRVEPGVWQYTAPDGSLTRYENGRPVAEWSGGMPVAAFTWDKQGRLTSIGDGVARTIKVLYAGSDTCPSSDWGNGFGPPDGLWCGLTNADGTSTGVGYVGDQIGLLSSPGGASAGLGWDAAGRLSAVRSSDAGAAAATAGGDWAGAAMTTQIAYDNDGRVASLTSGAASPDGPRVTRTYTYPTGDFSDRLTASADQVSGETKNGTVFTVTATADTWQVLSRTDLQGRTSKAVYDDATGALIGGTDPMGRTMTMKVDAESKLTASVGPYRGSPDTAMRTDRIMDATPTNPEQGADSPTKTWHGLAATVWDGDAATPAWWNDSVLKNGLAASLKYSGDWTAQATGTWTANESGTWAFSIKSSEGLSVDVSIDGARCKIGRAHV